ncbi:MAG: tRNA uridine-5-carboxymethylaminomethyl(34) synthesis GTPase MnmE [Candidatus Bostrichicola ureolyticus]|nr:MAG: tRNA uridine-5-carboxymethylaminomethyl(34) synthesis GTPase MnmE [Candidatus Bostrichicola ureolyticus]
MNNDFLQNDTIAAIATPNGCGAIAIIRISGSIAIEVVDNLFNPINKNKKLINQPSSTIHLGWLYDNNKILDQVLISLFKAPNSYTGEDIVEISCHGSPYIQKSILQTLIRKGIRLARNGEFTMRAFLKGKMDLSQVEALANLIYSKCEVTHNIAIQHIKKSYITDIKNLYKKIINFVSLIELELDFSEENFILVNKSDLYKTLFQLENIIKNMINAFKLGNAIKEGISVAIIGKPNVGKSTLFNALINSDEAIISELAGTTRDALEHSIIINGLLFRFIDTAGIHYTMNNLENLGIKKTFEKILESQIILYLVDVYSFEEKKIHDIINYFNKHYPLKKILIIVNKSDLGNFKKNDYVYIISAKYNTNIKDLINAITNLVYNNIVKDDSIITQNIYYEALNGTLKSINNVKKGLYKNLPEDLLTIDIRLILNFLSKIIGKINNEDILENIFSRFCIGK